MTTSLVPERITCVDCGGQCGRITHPPEDGFAPGDVVAYRCADCMDRWDVVVPADAEDDDEPWEPDPLNP